MTPLALVSFAARSGRSSGHELALQGGVDLRHELLGHDVGQKPERGRD